MISIGITKKVTNMSATERCNIRMEIRDLQCFNFFMIEQNTVTLPAAAVTKRMQYAITQFLDNSLISLKDDGISGNDVEFSISITDSIESLLLIVSISVESSMMIMMMVMNG